MIRIFKYADYMLYSVQKQSYMFSIGRMRNDMSPI
jgi:hypothetical protein